MRRYVNEQNSIDFNFLYVVISRSKFKAIRQCYERVSETLLVAELRETRD